MIPAELAEHLTGDEMQRLFEQVMEKCGKPFEPISVTKIGNQKQVLVKLQGGLQKIVVL